MRRFFIERQNGIRVRLRHLLEPTLQTLRLLNIAPVPQAFNGLCDLGMGCPEIGFVCMYELRDLRGPFGLPIERDLHFDADKTLSAYAAEAREHGRIDASSPDGISGGASTARRPFSNVDLRSCN